MKRILISVLLTVFTTSFFAQESEQKTAPQKAHYNTSKFKQLHEELPTPNNERKASGAPGHEYTQQQVDYKMNIVLDEENNKIFGDETITYHNNSKDNLDYYGYS